MIMSKIYIKVYIKIFAQSQFERYLDVFPGRFSTSFEFSAFQFQVQIVPHVAGHDHVGKAEFFR